MFGLSELLDVAIKFLTPVASSAASGLIQNAMAPKPQAPAFMGQAAPAPAQAAGAQAAGSGTSTPTSMNFQGGFTGQPPADPSQGPKPMSSGFSTLDPKKKPGMAGGFESVAV